MDTNEIKLELENTPAPAAPGMSSAEVKAALSDEPENAAEMVPSVETATLTSVVNAVKPDDSALTPEERKMVTEFAQKIDIKNAAQILQFGSSAQKKIAGFSEAALSNVRSKDMDQIGDLITGLVVELQGFSLDDNKKPGFFKKARNTLAENKAKYDTVEKNVDKICGVLEQHKVVLLKDVAMLDQMYEKNLAYYKELTMYVIAGREKLEEIIATELPVLQQKAKASGLAEDAQNANYLADMCNRFDKKLHDLELTRMVSLQMNPQIRLVQSTNNIMVEKIHSSLVNTIPLWKNQMVLALGMAHSQSAIKAQREVTDITNRLLRQNAETLKMNTIEAARESERSIVDIETLKYTNQSLITTLDEVLKIQQDGRQKRREAEAELGRIEVELKNKLLDIRDGASGDNEKIVIN